MEIFKSLGYMIEQNDRTTKIAHEITESGEYRDVLFRPSGSVISIHELLLAPAV